MTSSLTFPTVIDSSLLSAWKACRRKANLEYFHHWKPSSPSIHLHAGAAFAKACEVARKSFYDNHLDEDTSIALGCKALIEAYGDFECPSTSDKTLDRMLTSFEYMMTTHPMGEESCRPIFVPSLDRHAIEFSFLEPLSINHPETEEPILLSGRFDSIVNFSGQPFGLDDKTASRTSPAGAWDLRSQFTAYCWGAKRSNLPIEGFLVREVVILKGSIKVNQFITYRPDWMVEEWERTTLLEVRDMIEAWKSGDWRPNLDASCNSYGGCIFQKPCLSFDPFPWLKAGFSRRRWDPVHRIEIPIIEEIS